MGEALSKLFVPLHNLPELYRLPDQCVEPYLSEHEELDVQFGGYVQLGFLALVYGYVLFEASNLIAEGSELLLLIPEIAPIVGSVVIPILGAVPDSAVILFSGLGDKEEAQGQLSVGVGALAGSTIMLLTLPWTLSIVAGRVSISRKTGRCKYVKPANAGPDWRKLNPNETNIWKFTGVEPDYDAMKSGARIMGVTSVSYFIIQGAAFAYESDDPNVVALHEKNFALFGLILCLVLFFGYLFLQVKRSKDDKVLQDIVDSKRAVALQSGMLSLTGAFFNALNEFEGNPGSQTALLAEEHKHQRFESIVRKFFHQYDVNGDDTIDRNELKLLLTDLHLPHTKENLDHFMNEMDDDQSGDIHFNEFLENMIRLVSKSNGTRQNYGTSRERNTSGQIRTLMQHHEGSDVQENIEEQQRQLNEDVDADEAGEGEEEEDVPEDLADLPPEQQRRYILLRAARMMTIGTALVLLFSDPMVDVMSEIGEVIGISSFYISFILAPLASNASELIAAYSYALKKTSKTVTISLTSLEGAAIMNNTLCLGVFLALVYFRGLAWEFSAETIVILFVEAAMIYVAHQRVQTLRLSLFIASLFPLSLAIVFVLENVFGLD